MIIIKLQGGLGNQMFQYAFGRYLSLKNNSKLVLDLSFLIKRPVGVDYTFRNYELSEFDIKADIQNTTNKLYQNILSKIIGKFKILQLLNVVKFPVIIFQKDFKPLKKYLNFNGNYYLDGFWQSELFFKEFETQIRQDFIFKSEIHNQCKSFVSEIYHNNSVCLHIRRGDFLKNKENKNTHGLCSVDYYKKAINYINENVENPVFFVFTDDFQWSKSEFKNDNFKFFDFQDFQSNAVLNLQIMTQCKHFIISNSSFSWWAAWLSENKNKVVIAPKTWFADKNIDFSNVVPEDWIKF